MSKFISVLIVFHVLVWSALAQEEQTNKPAEEEGELSNVYELTINTFHSAIQEYEHILVEFYAPWCGACKKFAPEYEKAADQMLGKVLFTRFDAWNESNIPVTSAYNVTGYPTLFFFRKGAATPVTIDFTAEALVDNLQRKLRPDFVQLSSLAAVNEFTDKDNVTIVGFFEDDKSTEYQTFLAVAKKLKEQFLFGSVVGVTADMKTSFKLWSLPVVIVFKKFDEGMAFLEGHKVSDLEDFIEIHKFPLVGEIAKHNSKQYIESGIPIAFVFAESQEQKDLLAPRMRAIAKDTRKRLNFVFIDWLKYGEQSKKLGLSGTKVPCLALEDTKKKRHYAFDETKDLSTENVKDFVTKFLSGELQQTLISEPEPTDTSGAVKVVVGTSFERIVLDKSKHVFVEFYAPWCGHCKKLMPIWDQLGEMFKEHPTVVIAKINAEANDFPGDRIQMFPSLKLFKANDKEHPVIYESKSRTLEELAAFVRRHIGETKEESKEQTEQQTAEQKSEATHTEHEEELEEEEIDEDAEEVKLREQQRLEAFKEKLQQMQEKRKDPNWQKENEANSKKKEALRKLKEEKRKRKEQKKAATAAGGSEPSKKSILEQAAEKKGMKFVKPDKKTKGTSLKDEL